MSPISKFMLVEGKDDRIAIERLISLPSGYNDELGIRIEDTGGVDEILQPDFIPAKIKSSSVLGVMFDAGEEIKGRYESIYNNVEKRCTGMFSMPKSIPSEGLIVESNDRQRRFGIWIMPDNVSSGCLETFLAYLIPDLHEPIWVHANGSVTQAIDIAKNSSIKHCSGDNVDKAKLYTWLAWQEKPGQAPGTALTAKILNSQSPKASSFAEWFRNLYGLQPIASP